ncbi:uncharacterized protein LOC129899730 [Solanum dulcamara]|uniref:uncharacterized protein LOC129899730 n=1 Tax=Solanum dulcamara TaxID=45834 RepID=UPI0024857E03|nr:uncharacterized protein LOC129899730 [Solanum dulcamara]
MALDPIAFKTIVPSRYITFTIPNPLLHLHHFNASQLRVAVLDSPAPSKPIQIAAMLVPIDRETDWYFSTEQGHLQLLLNFPQLSRLVIIGNSPNSTNPTSYNPLLCTDGVADLSVVEENLMPLLIELIPKSAFCRTGGGLCEIPFLCYEDEVVRSLLLDRCVGEFVGEILIEDVELELENGGGREFRRRLRFKRMPNLVQTQIKIRPKKVDFVNMEEVEFEIVDDGVLVHPYLTPMVAGLSVIRSFLDAKIGNGIKPKALCLGVGGGALLGFLSSQLGFQVLGIEADNVVLQVARKYFGLESGNSICLCVGDALEMIGKFATQVESDGFCGYVLENGEHLDDFDGKFDVIMVDLDSSDANIGRSAPPLAFFQKSVLLATKTLLSKDGVVIINVIPSDQSSYKLVITEIQEVFTELYEIDVGNGDNFVLIASASEIGHVSSHHQSKFLKKLKQVSGSFVDYIRLI